jgi:hypothetical protein
MMQAEIETPALASMARRGGDGAAWRRDHPSFTAARFPLQQICQPAATLRAILAAAAEARRHGDHGAAVLLEHDALVAMRAARRDVEALA